MKGMVNIDSELNGITQQYSCCNQVGAGPNLAMISLSDLIDLSEVTGQQLIWLMACVSLVFNPFFKPFFGVLEYRVRLISSYFDQITAFSLYSYGSLLATFLTYLCYYKSLLGFPQTYSLQNNETLLVGYILMLSGLVLKTLAFYNHGWNAIIGDYYFERRWVEDTNAQLNKYRMASFHDPYYYPSGAGSILMVTALSLMFAREQGLVMAVLVALAYSCAFLLERYLLRCEDAISVFPHIGLRFSEMLKVWFGCNNLLQPVSAVLSSSKPEAPTPHGSQTTSLGEPHSSFIKSSTLIDSKLDWTENDSSFNSLSKNFEVVHESNYEGDTISNKGNDFLLKLLSNNLQTSTSSELQHKLFKELKSKLVESEMASKLKKDMHLKSKRRERDSSRGKKSQDSRSHNLRKRDSRKSKQSLRQDSSISENVCHSDPLTTTSALLTACDNISTRSMPHNMNQDFSLTTLQSQPSSSNMVNANLLSANTTPAHSYFRQYRPQDLTTVARSVCSSDSPIMALDLSMTKVTGNN